MAANIKEEQQPPSSSKRKRKREGQNHKLLVNKKVEVRGIEEGFRGSWHSGTVIACQDRKRTVKYDHLISEDGTGRLTDTLVVSPVIRPLPPPVDVNKQYLHYGQCVDVFHNEAWWEGVVIDHEVGASDRMIFFPDMGDEIKASIDILRITQDWDDVNEEWKPRGNWLFLEVIEETEKEWPVVVSVKQIWYEVRGKKGFEDLNEWTCSVRDVWKDLVLEVIVDYFKLTVTGIFHNLNPKGDSEERKEKIEPFLDCIEQAFYLSVSDLGFDNTCQLSHLPPNDPSQLVQESEFKEELASVMEGGSFMSLLTSSLKPPHVESQPPALSFFPCNASDTCQVSSKIFKQKLDKPAWHIAGPDLVPKAEYCPNAITDFNNKYTSGSKPSSAEMSNVRKHLSFLGWRIEHVRENKGKSKFRYFSPEAKPKCYYSLHLLCKDYNLLCKDFVESPSGIFSLTPQNDQNDQRSLALIEQPQVHEDLRDSSMGILSLVPQDGQESLANTPNSPFSEAFEDELTEPVYCPQAIVDYCLLGDSIRWIRKNDRKIKHLRVKVKKHLRSVGWSLFYTKKGSRRELRYKSPSGRVYISLITACQSYMAEEGKSDQKADASTRRKRSSIRARQAVAPSHHVPRTILCWLIDNSVVLAGEKVYYHGKNAEGRVTREGIMCNCCQCTFTLTEFETHVGSKNHRPAANIYLDDGRSLLDCQQELKRVSNRGKHLSTEPHEVKGNLDNSSDDYICSVCHDGGELVLCDQCPSSFHISCLGLKIFLGLHRLLGKPFPVSGRLNNLTWTLLKHMNPDSGDLDASNGDNLTENYSKLNVALGVMHECFEPVKEPRTQRDLVEDVFFNRWSELRRLNFRGFYTVVLERNEELITVATVRVYGEKVAEVPLVGTRFQFRRLGMCRVLMDELEKKLMELGVERLVLPAIPNVLDTWTGAFGFSTMTESDRLSLLDYTFLYFQDTIMCQKFLSKIPSESNPCPLIATEQKCSDINGNDMMNLDGNSAESEVFQAAQIEESASVDQRSIGIARDSTNSGNSTNPLISNTENSANPQVITMNKPTDAECPPHQGELILACSLKDSHYAECEKDGHGLFKCYKRRKVSACGS
ncbi:hypothetical protein LguiB_000693 [Lonicera macranthoides]